MRSGKRKHFWSALGDSYHRHAIEVEHVVGYYLAGSKCKPILCQKVYYSNRPKYFFLCVNNGTTSKFLKLVLDRMSKFGWMKQLVTILFFEIHSSAFIF